MDASFALIVIFSVFIAVSFLAGGALARYRPTPRSLPGYQALPGRLSRAIESGQSLHFSPGTGGVGGSDTAITLTGLTVLESLAEEAAAAGAPPVVTVADPTALVIAQDILRRAYNRQGNPTGYDPRSVRFMAPSPLPYAASAAEILSSGATSANVMVGVFGPEAVFITETGSKQGLAQIAGAADAASLAVMAPSVDDLLIGEEMLAAGSYVSERPVGWGSLLAQDAVRLILVLVISTVMFFALLSKLAGGAPR